MLTNRHINKLADVIGGPNSGLFDAGVSLKIDALEMWKEELEARLA